MLIASLIFSMLFIFVFISDYVEIETRGWRKEFKWTNTTTNSLMCIAIILVLLIIAQKACYNHAQNLKYKYYKYINEEVSYVKISEYK